MLDFLFVFGIMLSCNCTFLFMPSCICIFLSCFHVVCLFLFGCLVFIFFFKIKIKRKNQKNTKTMLWHSKSAMSMTSICFDIAKVQCQKLNIIGYFFSISYMPMHDLLKKNICKENKKKKESKCFKYDCKRVF